MNLAAFERIIVGAGLAVEACNAAAILTHI